MQVDLRPRSLGELVGQTLALSAAHFVRLFPITFVLSAPSVALEFYGKTLDQVRDPGPALLVSLISIVVSMAIWPLGAAAAITMVAGSFTGRSSSLMEGVRVGLRRLLPLLGATFAVSIIAGLATLLLIVPGLMVMTAFYVVPCVVVLEGLGVGPSMRRSRDLTRGQRWRVFGLFLVVGLLVQIVPAIGLSMLIEMGVQNIGAIFASMVVVAACAIPSTIAPVIVFFDLRVRKEAFDVSVLGDLVARIGEKVQRRASA